MNDSKTRFILGGSLGRKYGRIWYLQVASPLEALRLLAAQIPGLRQDFNDLVEKGVNFGIRINGDNRDLDFMTPGRTMLVMPIAQGAKSGGLFQVVLGAAIVAAAFIPGVGTGILFATMVSTGVGMAVGGIMQMISPMPKLGDTGSGGTSLESYYFNGGTNQAGAGGPVPVIYCKRMRVGSVVVNSSMVAR